MAESLFHAKLTSEIDAEIGDVTATLINGSCEDFADYKYKCGMIAGLERALAASTNVKKLILGEDRR